jgi:hypothetical protein
MNYENIYEVSYSKYYTKTESLIKTFLVKRRNQNKPFYTATNEVIKYLSHVFYAKYSLSNNKNLDNLHQIFCKRHTEYTINAIQGIFENEIKIEFDKIKSSELPTNYNYNKFIKSIALIEVENEISRLISNNARLLMLFYQLNDFEDFEIKLHRNLSLEDYPNYQKLLLKLHPEDYVNSIWYENLEVLDYRKNDLKEETTSENMYLGQASNENANKLFSFLMEYYRPEEKTSVKFVNILHFLKNDTDKDLFIFKVKQIDFKKMILEKAGIEIKKFAKSERYNEDEKPILNTLEHTFRKEMT